MPIAIDSGVTLLDDGEIQRQPGEKERDMYNNRTGVESTMRLHKDPVYIGGPVAIEQLFTPHKSA